jgi:hypothetical protein
MVGNNNDWNCDGIMLFFNRFLTYRVSCRAESAKTERKILFLPVIHMKKRLVFLWVIFCSIYTYSQSDFNVADSMLKHTLVKTVPNFPLLEEFTSSTCNPCAYYNSSFINPFISAHKKEMTIIKYQMNWPGSGDRYFTSEGASRRYFYGINSVPSLFFGGKSTSISSPSLSQSLTSEKSRQVDFEIKSSHKLDILSKDIQVNTTITPYLTNSSYRVFIAVVEKETTGNQSTNGETAFYYVMMKMIPDASGTTLNSVSNESINLTYSANLGNTHIEQFTDLAVVVFVQNMENKEIVQSAYSEIEVEAGSEGFENDCKIAVYPNPFRERVTLQAVLSGNAEIRIDIVSMTGMMIRELVPQKRVRPGSFICEWDGSDYRHQPLPSGIYLIRITLDDQIINRKVTLIR